MDAPTISIKINGLRAMDGQLLGGIKIKGANALMGMGGMEGNRMMAQNGRMMRMREVEDGRRMMQGQMMQAPMQQAPMQAPLQTPMQATPNLGGLSKGAAAGSKAAA